MGKRSALLILILGAFLALVVATALRRQPPDIPMDAEHVRTRLQPDACLSCHGPGGSHPRTPNHPMGRNQCWNCHHETGEVR